MAHSSLQYHTTTIGRGQPRPYHLPHPTVASYQRIAPEVIAIRNKPIANRNR